MKHSILNLTRNPYYNPLFLGESLGLQDYVRITYHKLENLALLQRSQFWTENEVDLATDRKQWNTLPKNIQDITMLNLAWQTTADSVLGRAPNTILLPLVSNSELEGMLIQWGYFENLHSRAYSNIIRNVLPEPERFIDDVTKNVKAIKRLDTIVDLFNKLNGYAKWYMDLEEDPGSAYSSMEQYEVRNDLEIKILETYYAIYALESIQFYSSFACTFGLAEQNILPGIAKNLQLIAKDEALHTHMSLEIINILITEFEEENIDKAKESAPRIMREILDSELEWAAYILSEGREVIGLNSNILKEYVLYIAKTAYNNLGVEWPSDLKAPTKHPIPWIDYWLDSSKNQPAPQEIQITSYRVGQAEAASEEERFKLTNEFEGLL